jgi:hypothetical protein
MNKPLNWIPLEAGILNEVEPHIGKIVFLTIEVLGKRTVVLATFKGRDTKMKWLFGRPIDGQIYQGNPLAIMPTPEPFI